MLPRPRRGSTGPTPAQTPLGQSSRITSTQTPARLARPLAGTPRLLLPAARPGAWLTWPSVCRFHVPRLSPIWPKAQFLCSPLSRTQPGDLSKSQELLSLQTPTRGPTQSLLCPSLSFPTTEMRLDQRLCPQLSLFYPSTPPLGYTLSFLKTAGWTPFLLPWPLVEKELTSQKQSISPQTLS